jgi:hypothetical protein
MSSPYQDPVKRMAHARAALAEKARAEAAAQFERMGITPTPDQLDVAGANILTAAHRDRMAVARASRWKGHADSKRAADADWAVTQVLRYADLVNAHDPSTPDHDIVRLLTMALADELGAPDGFSRPRFIKRLQSYVDRAKSAADSRSAELAASVLPDLAVNGDREEWQTGNTRPDGGL